MGRRIGRDHGCISRMQEETAIADRLRDLLSLNSGPGLGIVTKDVE